MNSPRSRHGLPPLTALRSFEAAARCGSFTQAAAELHVTHGAVSRQVKVLEEWAGMALFVRQGKRVSLTDAGRTFAEKVGDAFEDIAVAAKVLRADPGKQRVLSINALPTFAMRWLLPRLAGFQFQHPHVELRLVTSDLPLQRLAPLSFDVAIRREGDPVPSGYGTHAFLTEREIPVMSPALGGAGSIENAEALAKLPLLVADTRPGAWDRWFAAAGQESVMAGATLRRFDHFYLALQAAVDGLGVALGPLPLVDDDIQEGRLVLPIRGPRLSSAPYCWIVPTTNLRDPVIASFTTWLEEEGAKAGPA